jgi:RHS repeat-associated protein
MVTQLNLSSWTVQRANIYAGGEFLAEDSPDPFLTNTATATQLRITDQVGSLRGLSDLGNPSNLWSGAWKSFPYGDGAVAGDGADSQDNPGGMLFTGKERDAESGLDYFGARYYASNMGRFMSPDWSEQPQAIPYVDIENPQSLNLYGYVGNNPLRRADHDGHEWGCGGTTSGTNSNGDTVVYGNCHDTPDWFDFPGWAFTGFANILYGNPRQGAMQMAYGYTAEIATGLIAGEIIQGVGTVVRSASGKVVVERVMSMAELEATEKTGLLRGGRDGTHFVTDSAPDSASEAQQQLALGNTPTVKVQLEMDGSALSKPSTVEPLNGQPGGGTERTATGNVNVKILSVQVLK